MASAVYGGDEALHQRKHALHTEVEITKIQSELAEALPIRTHGGTQLMYSQELKLFFAGDVHDFIQEAILAGDQVRQHGNELPW